MVSKEERPYRPQETLRGQTLSSESEVGKEEEGGNENTRKMTEGWRRRKRRKVGENNRKEEIGSKVNIIRISFFLMNSSLDLFSSVPFYSPLQSLNVDQGD